jgi:hypothetical protein
MTPKIELTRLLGSANLNFCWQYGHLKLPYGATSSGGMAREQEGQVSFRGNMRHRFTAGRGEFGDSSHHERLHFFGRRILVPVWATGIPVG